MKPDAREAFFKWYASEKAKGTEFDMQRDLVAYCEQDVSILMQAGMKFRDLVLDQFKVGVLFAIFLNVFLFVVLSSFMLQFVN